MKHENQHHRRRGGEVRNERLLLLERSLHLAGEAHPQGGVIALGVEGFHLAADAFDPVLARLEATHLLRRGDQERQQLPVRRLVVAVAELVGALDAVLRLEVRKVQRGSGLRRLLLVFHQVEQRVLASLLPRHPLLDAVQHCLEVCLAQVKSAEALEEALLVVGAVGDGLDDVRAEPAQAGCQVVGEALDGAGVGPLQHQEEIVHRVQLGADALRGQDAGRRGRKELLQVALQVSVKLRRKVARHRGDQEGRRAGRRGGGA